MKKQLMVECLVVCFVLTLGSGVPAVAQHWTGAGVDNLWDNPDNWDSGILPGDTEKAFVDGPAGAAPNGPIIQDGIEAVTQVFVSEGGASSTSITGGSLELVGWGMWLGDGGNAHPTINMSGGLMKFTGSPGIFEMGWQSGDDIAAGKTVSGTLNLTGGRIDAKGAVWPDKSPAEGASATANLIGGRLNVGKARNGFDLREGSRVDITGGLLVVMGDPFDVEPQLNFYINDGLLVGYDGLGQIVITAGLPGDLDADNDADGGDFLKWQQDGGTAEALSHWRDSFGLIAVDEFDEFRTVSALPPAGGTVSIPEPSSAALAILCLCSIGFWSRRRNTCS